MTAAQQAAKRDAYVASKTKWMLDELEDTDENWQLYLAAVAKARVEYDAR